MLLPRNQRSEGPKPSLISLAKPFLNSGTENGRIPHLEPSDESNGIYQLSMHGYEEKELGDAEVSVLVARRWKYRVAMHSDRVHIEALADFLRDALGITQRNSDEPQPEELATVS